MHRVYARFNLPFGDSIVGEVNSNGVTCDVLQLPLLQLADDAVFLLLLNIQMHLICNVCAQSHTSSCSTKRCNAMHALQRQNLHFAFIFRTEGS